MGLRINTNLAAIHARNALEDVTGRMQDTFRRLSTGLRISTAADDAAGLAISERLRARVRSLEQAKRNANDGISLIQTAEGAMEEVSSILIRLRELSIQASNGTVSDADRDVLQEEFAALRAEIDRIGRSTHFNNGPLLDGSASVVSFQIGIGANTALNQISVSIEPVLSTSLALDTLDIGSSGDTSLAITQIDSAINTVSRLRGSLGALQNRLGTTIRNLSVHAESLTAAESRIRDADVAYETANLTRLTIIQEAALAILSQANAQPTAALTLLA